MDTSERSTVETPKQITRRRRSVVRRSEEHTSELQSQSNLVCRLLLEKKKKKMHDLPVSGEGSDGVGPSHWPQEPEFIKYTQPDVGILDVMMCLAHNIWPVLGLLRDDS